MISSTAVPSNDLLTDPLNRNECIVNWPGIPAALRCACSAAVIRGAVNGTVPRSPLSSTIGNKYPAVKSQPMARAAAMCSVTPRTAKIGRHSPSAKITTETTDFLSVFPKWKLKINPADSGSHNTREPKVRDRSKPRSHPVASTFSRGLADDPGSQGAWSDTW